MKHLITHSIFLATLSLPAASLADSLRIAALVPLTGGAAEQGEWVVQGLQLAAAELKDQKNIQVDLQIQDTQGDPRQAVNAYTTLATSSRPSAVITWGSGVGMALTPKTNQDQVIQMGVATATPTYRTENDFTFRNYPSAELEAAFVEEAIRNKTAAGTVGIVKIDNDYGQGSARAFRAAFEQQGSTIAFEEELEPNATDFRSLIAKIKQRPASLIFLTAYPSEGALFIRQARTLGVETPIIATTALIGGSAFFSLIGAAGNGIFVTSSTPVFLVDTSPNVIRFVSSFRSKFGNPPGPEHIYAARAYDALLLLGQAYAECQSSNTSCMREKLFTVVDYHGASGTLSFDRAGDVTTNFSLYEVRDNQFIPTHTAGSFLSARSTETASAER